MAPSNMKKILVFGPVVIDTIQNKERHGGTAGNMAYGLGLLGAKPMLFSLAGDDFHGSYGKHLKKEGVDLRVHIDKKNKTARYYELSATQRVWHPNAYKNIHKVSLNKTISKKHLKGVDLAIFSSSPGVSMIKHIENFKKHAKGALVIFDPGQTIYQFSKNELKKCITLSDIFIINEDEYAQAKKCLGKDPRNAFVKKIIIETLGAKGSLVFAEGKMKKVSAIRPRKVLDATGAGDAYRAGLIFGLSRDLSLIEACGLGAKMASKNIEYVGCQEYKFSI